MTDNYRKECQEETLHRQSTKDPAENAKATGPETNEQSREEGEDPERV
jgi:hypothetical protein